MQKITNTRGRVIATLLVSLMFLAALIVYQSTAAQEQPPPVTPLNPPFKFEVDRAAFIAGASGFPSVPPSATRLLTETFGDNYQQTATITGTAPAWRYYVDPGSGSTLYWNRVISLVTDIYTDTAWASCGLCNGGLVDSLNPDTDNYPPGQGAWLVYGPITLTDYYAAEVTFNYRIDVRAGDAFWFGVSSDGTTFGGSKVPIDGDFASSGWLTHTFNLGGYAGRGKPSAYLGFYFQSNDDASVGKGVFIDNVSLRAAPYSISYLPQVARNFAIATATPTLAPYLYNYTWPVGGEFDPDFVVWGQSYTKEEGGTTVYQQGITGGNPGSGMYLYNTRTFLVTMAGPNKTVSGNYEISAQFNVYKSKDNARYGIIFGAATNAFSRSGSEPRFNANADYYAFALQFPSPPNGNRPADFQLELCNTGDGSNCNKLVDRTPIPSGANADGVWDTLKVRRQGNQITIFVNNVQLATVSDGTLTGTREFGVYIRSQNVNGTGSPLEVNWDNYTVTQLP